jgi:hypothetical protein
MTAALQPRQSIKHNIRVKFVKDSRALIEPRGVLNTGDVGGERTAEQDVWI